MCSDADYSDEEKKKTGNENQACVLLDMMDQQKMYFSVKIRGGNFPPYSGHTNF